MFTPRNKTAAKTAMGVLEKRGAHIKLDPALGLGKLVNLTMPVTTNELPATDAPIDDVIAVIEANSDVKNSFEVAEHTELADELIEQYSESMSAIINFTRDVVTPRVNHVYENVVDAINAHKPKGHNISKMAFDPILDTPPMENIMLVGDTAVEADAFLDMAMPSRTEEQIAELLSTGGGVFDTQLAKAFGKMDDNWLVDIYNYFFVGDGTLKQLEYDRLPEQALRLVAVVLIANGLKESPPEGLGMSLEMYQQKLALFSIQARLRYRMLLQARDRYSRLGVLVMSRHIPTTSPYYDAHAETNVIVNDAVYTRFIEQGGSPEVIIGLVVCGDVEDKLDAILSKKDFYIEQFNAHQQKSERALLAQGREIARDKLVIEVLDAINESPEEERVPDTEVGQLLAAAKEFIEQQQLHLFSEEQLYVTTRTLMCNTLYAHTDAGLLFEYGNICKQYVEDNNPREIMYRAALMLLIANLFEVSDVSVSLD